jgi:2-(1,2-epoxy-1,2-dihydrophenyl)acetyl-CoA isomerase
MDTVLFEIKNNVAILTLNRPEKFNAFNREMALRLQKLLDDCSADKNIRAVYITATGKAFSSGQDITELTGENKTDIEKAVTECYNPIITKIRTIEKPVVCAVNGVAAGAGANIALCADIVVAAESALFTQAFSKIGLIPDSGGTFILPRLIGFQKASALMLLGDKINAVDAEKLGMIYKAFPDETFVEESMKIAITLSKLPTKALAYTKQALNLSFNNSLEQQLHVEDQLQYAAANTHDFKEGINAFLERRLPEFKGE